MDTQWRASNKLQGFLIVLDLQSCTYLTWDQAQFSFRFVITFRRARRNESRAWYKPSTKRLPPTFLIDWHLLNQPTKITSVACFSSMQIFHAWEKCRLADLKNSFYLLIKRHLVSGQQLAEGFNSAIHSLSVNKANPEKIWTTIWIFWISMTHIKAYFPTIRP